MSIGLDKTFPGIEVYSEKDHPRVYQSNRYVRDYNSYRYWYKYYLVINDAKIRIDYGGDPNNENELVLSFGDFRNLSTDKVKQIITIVKGE